MSTPRKATTASRSREKKSAVTGVPDDIKALMEKPLAPVVISKRDRAPEEMTTVFHLDGKDYQIPVKPGPAIVIKYLRDARKIGEQQAGFNVLNAMLGDEALEALSESPDVTDEDITRIYEIVTKVFFEGVANHGAAQGN